MVSRLTVCKQKFGQEEFSVFVSLATMILDEHNRVGHAVADHVEVCDTLCGY